MRTTKLAGIAGITWAAVNSAAALSAGSPPALDAPAADIRRYYADHRTALLASAFLFLLTLPALFAFFGELIGRPSTDERSGVLSGGAGAALAVFAGAFGLAYLSTLPLALDAGLRQTAPAGLVQYAWASGFIVTMLGNVAFGVVLLAIGAGADLVSHRARVAATAIGALTVAVSAIGVVNADVIVAGGLSFLVLAVWMVVVGIGLVRHDGPAAAGALAPAGI